MFISPLLAISQKPSLGEVAGLGCGWVLADSLPPTEGILWLLYS
ncbi:hypothetical protein [Cylindrospermum sp. FACHB-282]|nr:hypothetical protein [Cylindrospermum sp. FACHB-282]